MAEYKENNLCSNNCRESKVYLDTEAKLVQLKRVQEKKNRIVCKLRLSKLLNFSVS